MGCAFRHTHHPGHTIPDLNASVQLPTLHGLRHYQTQVHDFLQIFISLLFITSSSEAYLNISTDPIQYTHICLFFLYAYYSIPWNITRLTLSLPLSLLSLSRGVYLMPFLLSIHSLYLYEGVGIGVSSLRFFDFEL